MESSLIDEEVLVGIKNWVEAHETNCASQIAALKLFEAIHLGHTCLKWENAIKTSLPIVYQNGLLYFERYWYLENKLVKLFKELSQSKLHIIFDPPQLSGKGLTEEQEEAIRKALVSSLFFITGGPGTGKTHTAGLLIAEMKRAHPELRIAIAAPTGKAVGQLKKSLSRHIDPEAFQAFTLHRLLELYKEDPILLPFDTLLVDEASMIDLEMMVRLFDSVKPGSHLILMGDPWQLPPIEAGSIFSDLVMHAPKAHLSKCLRAELKDIVEFAELIKLQDAEGALNFLKSGGAGLSWHRDDQFNFNVTDKPVLTPLKKGRWGSEGLNQKGLKENRRTEIPIMITRNHYELELYNGDLGVITSLHPLPGDVAYLGDRRIPALLLPSWDLAWALSIHKSQGSEFDEIRIVLPEGSHSSGMSSLYTAVTRAKKHCEIWASEETLRLMINTSSKRESGLAHLF